MDEKVHMLSGKINKPKGEKMKVLIESRSFGARCEKAVDIVKEIAQVERSAGPMAEDELTEVLPSYDGVIVGIGEITKKVIEASNKLKVVAKHGVGLDNIDLNACTKNGVIVTYLPSINADSVADFTFCLILALARKLMPAHISAKAGEWESKKFIGTDLYGKTIGIIGLGAIGSRVARVARGFDMRVLCATGHPEKHREEGGEYKIEFVDLSTLLKESDVVTVHCPLTPETKGMIGDKEFSLMKESAFLINTARGPIVDEKAAYNALKEKKIAGAAFDVYETEPPSTGCPLFKLDNVVVTPHIAAYTIDAFRKMDLTLAQDVVNALRGIKPNYVANPDVFL